jgi:hypothetical protein
MKSSSVILLLPILAFSPLLASDLYVSPSGSDTNSGTKACPLATMGKARDAARTLPHPVTVHLDGGTYYLPSTLSLGFEDSGTTWIAEEGQTPIVSGGVKLDLKWEPYKDGIMQAKVPADLLTEELFVNGERQILARYPNYDPKARFFDGFAADAISKERVARWANPSGGYFHAMHPSLWGDFTWVITGKDAKGEITKEGGWQNNRGGAIHPKIRFVENIFEELDAPGEWFLNRKTHVLYYYPRTGVDLSKALVEATRLRTLVEFRGSKENPVRNVVFKGLSFRQANRTVMETKEPLLRTDWAIFRGGALFLEGTTGCRLEDLLIDQVGGNAVFVNGYNRGLVIQGCEIFKAGASGIVFLGETKAVRSPLFNYDQRQGLKDLDRTPGPKTDDYPADCLVDDCLIHLTGRVEKQTAGICIDIAQSITVRHCSIYDMPRAGINIGDGCWGGHLIEGCDVFDTVKETGDHGSFNGWGRDRYWLLRDVPLDGMLTNPATADLPFLDAMKTTEIRNNRWRCDHGWDIDLDDGCSDYWLHDNLCLHGGIKNREGYRRINENNITVGSGFHVHVWPKGSGDIIRHNIIYSPYAIARVVKPWGKEIDFNLFHSPGVTTPRPAKILQQQSGHDEHSVEADALFADPAHGDYSVKEGSPAIALGFRNFPMTGFGVTSPKLLAKTRTPQLPVFAAKELASSASTAAAPWYGASARAIEGMEFSAYGVAEGEEGVALLEVPPASTAAKIGFRKGDLLQTVNGTKVPTLAKLQEAMKSAQGKLITIGYVRDQKAATMTFPLTP